MVLTVSVQYKGQVFKVAMYDQWLVVVTGSHLVHEIQTLPDDKISFIEGVGEVRESSIPAYSLQPIFNCNTAHRRTIHHRG